MKTGIRKIEAQAKAWLLATERKPKGTDRSPYVSIDYCACGMFECVTSRGARDYVALGAVIFWLNGGAK